MKHHFMKIIGIAISLLLTFSSFSIIAYAENYTESEEQSFPYGLGGLPVDEAEVESYLKNPTFAKSSLPSSVDLSNKFPIPGNQGNQNSCSGWAVSYACMSASETKKRNWTPNATSHAFSPSYIYNQINGGANVSTSIVDALNILKSQGACTLSYWPYSESGFAISPNLNQRANATLYTISDWYTVSGIDNIKKQLYSGMGVIIWINVFPQFARLNSSNAIYNDFSGNSSGGHYVCLVGYNDSMKAFKFINSWGTEWGANGYGWIEYSSMQKSKVTGFLLSPKGYCIKIKSTDDYILGDVDGNGKVDATDSRTVLRYSAKLETPTSRQYVLGDVDGDGNVTAEDSRYILRYASRQISKLPLYD